MPTQTPAKPRHVVHRPKRKPLQAKPVTAQAVKAQPEPQPLGMPTAVSTPDMPAQHKTPCDSCQHAPKKPGPPPGSSAAMLDRLEEVLRSLAGAQSDLTDLLEQQHTAMTGLDTAAMDKCASRQESLHRRVMQLEHERRTLVHNLATSTGLSSGATLRDLADAFAAEDPQRRLRLLELRDLLRQRSAHAAKRGRRCSRVAGSVLGSINTALRLLTRSCIYSKTGNFQMPPRRPRMEAVG